MCKKEIKRLTALSECPHLNKTDRDALIYLLRETGNIKVEPGKGFDGYDFSSWPSMPGKELFKEVIKSREAKNKVIMTQSWISSAGPHLNFLKDKGVDVNTAMKYCAKNGWQGFGAQWVLNEIEKDKLSMPELIIGEPKTEDQWINNVIKGQVTSIGQIEPNIRDLIQSRYRIGKYKPDVMQALERIGFAV